MVVAKKKTKIILVIKIARKIWKYGLFCSQKTSFHPKQTNSFEVTMLKSQIVDCLVQTERKEKSILQLTDLLESTQEKLKMWVNCTVSISFALALAFHFSFFIFHFSFFIFRFSFFVFEQLFKYPLPDLRPKTNACEKTCRSPWSGSSSKPGSSWQLLVPVSMPMIFIIKSACVCVLLKSSKTRENTASTVDILPLPNSNPQRIMESLKSIQVLYEFLPEPNQIRNKTLSLRDKWGLKDLFECNRFDYFKRCIEWVKFNEKNQRFQTIEYISTEYFMQSLCLSYFPSNSEVALKNKKLI